MDSKQGYGDDRTRTIERFVQLLDTNPVVRSDMETLLGVKFDSMKFGERVAAVCSYIELGRMLTVFNGAARAIRNAGIKEQIRSGRYTMAELQKMSPTELVRAVTPPDEPE